MAVRSLRATPIVTVVAILSLALGIGANTAIFSLVNSLLLRALPVKEPAQLAMLTDGTVMSNGRTPIVDQSDLGADPVARRPVRRRLRLERARASTSPPAARRSSSTASGPAVACSTRSACRRCSAAPSPRRTTRAAAGRMARSRSSVTRFWQRRFGGAADVLGKSLTVEHMPFTIVGVTGPDFFGPDVGRAFDVADPDRHRAAVPRQGVVRWISDRRGG